MKYPNNINKTFKHKTNYDNRGLELETLINTACKYYLEQDMAIIYKKPTPIGIVNVDYENGGVINKAFFKEPSTLDYNGIYKGKYIEFDAKECHRKTAFPLNNIHRHQINHIKGILRHGGIAFLIISMNSKYFLFKGEDLICFLNKETRKSIPYNVIEKKGFMLKANYNLGIDFLEGINQAYEGVKKYEKNKI